MPRSDCAAEAATEETYIANGSSVENLAVKKCQWSIARGDDHVALSHCGLMQKHTRAGVTLWLVSLVSEVRFGSPFLAPPS